MSSSLPPPPRKASSMTEQRNQRILVGVAGGSAAGKTTLCQNIYRQMAFDRNFKVEIIRLDSFYKNVDKSQVDITEYNFDHPNALDFDLAYKTLLSLIESDEAVPVPTYSFVEHARQKEVTMVGPANIIFFEGLMSFYDKRIRDLFTYKIFINCDDDIRLCRRLKRDTTERGRSVISVLEQYNKFVKNAFRDFILPSIVYADIIIPGFRNNRVSVDFIVQHIKNMARRITFKERAVKTKTFIFGESQIYDLECLNNYETKVTMEQESFLVFPTSNEHKKQLQFFLTSLLSEIFSQQYFHEIYMHQFLKVLKTLLSQLMALKSFKSQSMQIFSIYNIKEVLHSADHEKHPIKVLFYPVAERQHARDILSQVKGYIQKYPKANFVILNAFCDLNVPQMIYKLKLSNVIMINLFVIANDRRFREIMANNISVSKQGNFDWFLHNHEIANQAVNTISKEFKIYQRPEEEIAKSCYLLQLQKIKEEDRIPERLELDEAKQKFGVIQQRKVYSQQHPNLCGYHALNTILCLQNDKDICSRQNFVENYHHLAKGFGKIDYSPLQRYSLSSLLETQLLAKQKNIGVLLFSFKYIQNTEQQNEELQRLFNELHSGAKSHIYVILGVHSHYVLLRVEKDGITFYDSLNNSLRDIMNDTQEMVSPSQKEHKDYRNNKLHRQNLRQTLEIVLDLFQQKKTVQTIMLQKIIEDVTDSFDAIRANEAEIDNWLKNEYPKEVLESQLMRTMRQKKVDLSEQHKKKFNDWLSHPKIKALFEEKEGTLLI